MSHLFRYNVTVTDFVLTSNGIFPHGETIMAPEWGAERCSFFDGKLWQPHSAEEREIRLQEVESFVADDYADIGNMTLRTYRRWVELDWKTEHGTLDSADRFSTKLKEEFTESIEEFDYRTPRNDRPDRSIRPPDQLASELGDIGWCTIALASNAGISIEETIKQGLRNQDLRLGLKPAGKITLLDIDYLLACGHQPHFSPYEPAYEVGDVYTDYDELNPYTNLRLYASMLANGCERQFDNRVSTNIVDPLVAGYIAPLAGKLLEITAYYSWQWALPFHKVVADNMRKITQRVASRQIDKADRPRS